MAKTLCAAAWLVVLAGCGGNPSQKFAKLAEEYVYTTLAFSPAGATANGLHEYAGQKLDFLLDDLSSAALDRQRNYYKKTHERLAGIQPERLTPEERADYRIIEDQVALGLLDLDELQSAMHNPTLYVETLGNALFSEFVLEYAPWPDRMRHIIARLQKVPLFLDQASSNLISSPKVWTRVALEENLGNINLVDKTLRAAAPPELRADYERAARNALEAMHKFQGYLERSLIPRDDFDWRLGSKHYQQKFRYALDAGMEADSALQAADHDLGKVRARMLEIALPLHASHFAAHGGHTELDADARVNAIVGEVLDQIARRGSTRESYLDDARRDLDEARAFVAAKRFLTLPAHSNLKLIETPEFMRGIYAVGGFNPAPALEPRLGAFYWVTPIPAGWSKERASSKLREYNFFKLKLLTIHEAMPGHYVQSEFANAVEPRARRLLRGIYGNGPYIEGWAQYATQTMLEAGFLDGSPEMALTFAKEELRVIANAMLDIRLHMLNMTDEEALDLMQKQTFQEAEEAQAKLQRAKLSSCQLPMYYLGWRGWVRARDEYKQAKGAGFQPAEFHDRALRAGAVPLPVLVPLLTQPTGRK
jgi:uncharacterized protein (DUF885 family)